MPVVRLLHSVAVTVVVLISTLAISLATLLIVNLLRRSDRAVQPLARGWARLILFTTGVRVCRRGGEALDPSASYIFAANHQSQYDIFVLQGYLGHDFRWLAKKELFRVPVWGPAMRSAGYIPVDRAGGRQAMRSLNEAASRIAGGTSVVIFPEGTRSPDGRLQDFKAGGMQLAIKAGVPVVPVAIAGTHRILPKGRIFASPGRVTVRIGRPVETGSVGARQKQELADRIRAEVAALLEDAPGQSRGEEAAGGREVETVDEIQ